MICGFAAYGGPAGPDQLLGLSAFLGAAFIFVFWSLSVLSYGNVFAVLLGYSPSDFLAAAVLGITFSDFLAIVLGHLGLLGLASFPLGVLVTALGFVLRDVVVRHHPTLFKISRPVLKFDLATGAKLLFALYFVLFLAKACLVQSYWDPLWYHLVGPRIWFENSRVFLPPDKIFVYQVASWEYLLLWANSLLGGDQGGGLVAVQLFGQWLHLFWGFLGSAFVLSRLFEWIAPKSPWRWAAILIGLAAASLNYVIPIAKNDFGVIFMSLGGLVLLLESAPKKKATQRARQLALGCTVGLALTAKLTSFFVIAPFLLLLGWRNPKGGMILVGVLLGALPMFVRNALATGNPFFPSMGRFFGSAHLGPTWVEAISHYEGKGLVLSLDHLKIMLLKMVQDSPMSPVFFIGILLSAFWRKEFKQVYLITAFSCLLFIMKAGESAEFRLIGGASLLVPSLSLLGVGLGIEGGLKSKKLKYLSHGVCVLGLLFCVHFNWGAAQALWEAKDPSLQIREHVGGSSMAWLREHSKPNESIVSLSETRLYYLQPLQVSRIWDYPELDEKMTQTHTALEAVHVLREFGYHYLLDTMEQLDLYYNLDVCRRISHAIDEHAQSVVFNMKTSRVVDLAVLEAQLK